MTFDSISHKDLMHHRLQAIIRDNNFKDLEYVGVINNDHVYNISGNLVSVSQIEELTEI